MNPYVERASVWHDFHESFIPLVREILTPQVLPRYFIRIDEQMYIHEQSAEERRFLGRGDVQVTARTPPGAVTAGAGSVLEAPAEVGVPAVDTEGRSFLEIRDREGHELVTVVELLSPSCWLALVGLAFFMSVSPVVGADMLSVVCPSARKRLSQTH